MNPEVEEEIDMDEDDGVDPFEYLGSMLQTDEGESITNVLNKISSHIENQNKILIKIVSLLNSKQ